MMERDEREEAEILHWAWERLRASDARFLREMERSRREEDRDPQRWIGFGVFVALLCVYGYAGEWFLVLMCCTAVLVFAWIRSRLDHQLDVLLARARSRLDEETP